MALERRTVLGIDRDQQLEIETDPKQKKTNFGMAPLKKKEYEEKTRSIRDRTKTKKTPSVVERTTETNGKDNKENTKRWNNKMAGEGGGAGG